MLGTLPPKVLMRGEWAAAGGTEGRAWGARGKPAGLLQVLETYMFHVFLKARLSRRMDAFAQMELHTQSEEDRSALGSEGGGTLGAPGAVWMGRQSSQLEKPHTSGPRRVG